MAAVAAMSFTSRINGAGGQTKPLGASAPPALGPEHGATPPPAKAPPPLGPRPLGPLQITLAGRRGAQQAGVQSEGRTGQSCRAMSGVDTQASTQVAPQPPTNPEVPPPVLANSPDDPPAVPKEMPGNNVMVGPPKERARRRSRTRRSPAAPQVDSPAKSAALESMKSTPRRNEEGQSTACTVVSRLPHAARVSDLLSTRKEAEFLCDALFF